MKRNKAGMVKIASSLLPTVSTRWPNIAEHGWRVWEDVRRLLMSTSLVSKYS